MTIETLIGLAVGALVLALAVSALVLGTRTENAGHMLDATRGAMLLQQALYEDLRQAGVPPGAADPLRLAPHALAFYRVHLEPVTVRLLPASWQAQARPDGTLRLHRRVQKPDGAFAETTYGLPLAKLTFSRRPGAGRGVLRAEFVVAAPRSMVSPVWTLSVPMSRPIGLGDPTLDNLLDLGPIPPL